jgi:predicted MPP superfamily phosphohydrolase
MKIIAIGDLHGRDDWKKIISKEVFDKIVFMADYFDTLEAITPQRQKENFKNIVEYKRKNAEKVVLLTGNHDYHYLRTTDESYSGFQALYKSDFGDLLHDAIDHDLLQMCFIFKQFLFVHAGITKTWAAQNNIDLNNPEQSVNDLFRFKPNRFAFTDGKNHDPYGDDICQTPIWVRPKSLLKDRIEGFVQIVGHTAQKKLIIETDVVLIDTIETSGEYLQIIDGEMSAIQLNN